jgi:sulfite reductase (NADPH) hemoprotein beta-component
MYQYDEYDHRLVNERVEQFRGQVRRRLAGEITEDEFKPLRLQNGLYMQLHAYMLRVNIPYGLFSSTQMRTLAHVARKYDRGYGHFSTRQNIQYNWPKLEEVPDILLDLAKVEMHAIQSSGNCIRNVTADHLAGVARDEVEDPRPYCEIIRQWSTFHPEFAFLPRKFKIAVTGAPMDRAAVRVHDIGIRIVENERGERGFEIWAGGGLGRTPRIGQVCGKFVPKQHLLSYLEAILRVYNQYGRRDNKYKARIKILVGDLGIDAFREQVEAEWNEIKDSAIRLTQEEIERVKEFFAAPDYADLPDADAVLAAKMLSGKQAFRHWVKANVRLHKKPGYAIAFLSLKPHGKPPGDITADQMDAVAELADRFSFGEIRSTHDQNLVFGHVRVTELEELWKQLDALGLASPNIGTATDMIACPGMDYCNLANARSIPVAQDIARRLDDFDYLHELGPVSLKISGCINACGHHHVGNIGILGIDKEGVEHYQLTLGGSPSDDATIGKIVGPAFDGDQIVTAVEETLALYLDERESADERFLDYYRRVGPTPFKERLYA